MGQAQISRITFYRPGELPGIVLESAPETTPELRHCVVPVPSRPVTCETGEDCSKCLALAGHLQREADAVEAEHQPYHHQANWLQRLFSKG
ncbi:hypothetical protein K9N68_38595 (plasmid) [Kovacikia minuta CCNUW1]|uniref:hypothetical protein n=1 Tax=Kovacikia minuta TaxID=2931930 RepID=UPI001CCB2CD2|nr:hypothetical protein [Kovacikia minuta]UBF30093.1 hypothetical protein K9N68_38595 [Kovacikia minuta CCNUW1]